MLAGCASGAQTALPYMRSDAAVRAVNATGAGKIKHVIFIVQENRSFDNLFQGYPGADTVSQGMNSYGQTITLTPSSLKTVYVIDHSAYAMFAACNGTGSLPGTNCQMNGFNNEPAYGGPTNPQYVYVPHSESKPYFDMAREWAVGDRMFQSQVDESFVAHQYVIAAQAQSSVDLPLDIGAAREDRTTRFRRSRKAATPMVRRSRRVSIIRRLATSSTRRTYRGASMPFTMATTVAATGERGRRIRR